MGSKHGNQLHLFTSRIHQLLKNKRFVFLLATSVFFAALLTPNNYNSSPKRKGVGTRDATGELHSILRRSHMGRASVAIVKVVDDETDPEEPQIKYLVQRKSHDYPIAAFRGSICLLGGNANKLDASPVETLIRELKEELGSAGSLSWIHNIKSENIIDDSSTKGPMYTNSTKAGQIRYLGLTKHTQSSSILQKPHEYSFVCALYEITLYPFQLPPNVLYPRGALLSEGSLVLLTEEQLVHHAKYAWGYEFTVRDYFGKNVSNVCEGVSVESVEEEEIGEWRPEKR